MKIIDNFSFGDIIIARIPFSDKSNTKIRPVLVLAKDRDDYLLMKISSVLNKKSNWDIVIPMNLSNWLRSDSIFKIKKIWSFSKEILWKKIGKLSLQDSKEIKSTLVKFVQSF